MTDGSRASAATLESRWQQLFSGSRKTSYRPPGVYGGIVRRSKWKQYYVNEYVRPADPTDYNDPAYDWSRLDEVFSLNSVQNEGALVAIGAGEVGYAGWAIAPAWLSNSTYNGTYQKDKRPLIHATEGNGQSHNTYFHPDIPNPWGYSGVSQPQTASHILWALSGSPKGQNKDSGLGQVGADPSGIMPVHTIIVDWGRTWSRNSPSLEEWHEAIDTFGPPGTFAFPYFPEGYQP